MIKKRWVSIDPWRGYYEPDLPPPSKEVGKIPEDFMLVASCNAVTGQEEDMAKIREITKEVLSKHDFKVKTGFMPSSNIFSANFYILAKPKEPRKITSKDVKALECVEKETINAITSGFSIWEGKTYPIDINRFKEKLNAYFVGD